MGRLVLLLIMSVCALCGGVSAQPAPPAMLNSNIINPVVRSPQGLGPQLYTRARAATVEILTDGRLDGTGFIIAPDGRFITAAHVVEQPRKRIEARTIYGRVEAHLLALDLGHDLALMQLDSAPTGADWPALSIASHMPPVTAPVYLLGTPNFRHHVLLRGMMARDLPTYEYLPELHRYVSIMHVSASSPAGTSGGPWMNGRGEVVGAQSGMMTSPNGPVGVAYMAPLPAIQALVRRGVDTQIAWPGLAVEELWEQRRSFIAKHPEGTEGLVVMQARGPAREAGLRYHDIIVAIDGRHTPLRDDLIAHVRAKSPGETVTLTVLRGDERRRVKLTLGLLRPRAR